MIYLDLSEKAARDSAGALVAAILVSTLSDPGPVKTAVVASLALMVTPETLRKLGPDDPLPLSPGTN